MAEILVGRVTHYFSRIGVAALDLQVPLSSGDEFHIVGSRPGSGTDVEGVVESMEIQHKHVACAIPGDDVALKVKCAVKEGDKIYKRVKGALMAGAN